MRWILLRGLTRERRHWGSFPDILRAHLPDAELLSIDLPGNGERWAERSPDNIAATVAACRTDLAARQIAPPFGLLAMSLGAMVAADWARRYPDEISACVLINTSMRPFSPFIHRLHPRNYAALLRLLLPGVSASMREQTICRMTSTKHQQDETLLNDWKHWFEERPVSPANGLRQLLAAARYRASREAPQTPVLMLASQGDRLVDCRCSARIAAAWNSSLMIHPSAGHDLPLDDPHWVATAIAAWVEAGMLWGGERIGTGHHRPPGTGKASNHAG